MDPKSSSERISILLPCGVALVSIRRHRDLGFQFVQTQRPGEQAPRKRPDNPNAPAAMARGPDVNRSFHQCTKGAGF
jgi:hypothetical protein